jgi:hypothetical protein
MTCSMEPRWKWPTPSLPVQMAAFFGQMSFDQTGVQVCLAPCVTRPLSAKKSTKVGRVVFMSFLHSFREWCQIWRIGPRDVYSSSFGDEMSKSIFEDIFWAIFERVNKMQ